MKKHKLCMILFFLVGCTPTTYEEPSIKTSPKDVEADAFILRNANFEIVPKNEYEQAETVYYASDELELAKIIQSNIEKDIYEVAYQPKTEMVMDIDKVVTILSHINAYDISLTQYSVDYTDIQDKVKYKSYSIKVKNLDERYEEALLESKRIISEIIEEGMGADEKIEAIHDYIVKTSAYDEKSFDTIEGKSSIFKAAGVLVDQRAVCTGYGRAFMMLAKEANIPSIYVSSDIINHGWNLVYGENGWRYIDVTWDDPVPDREGVADDKFLNLSIIEFLSEGSHKFDEGKNSEYYLDLANNFYNLP